MSSTPHLSRHGRATGAVSRASTTGLEPRGRAAVLALLVGAVTLGAPGIRAVAQEPTPDQARAPGIISGRVIDEGTGAPIPDVRIRVEGTSIEALTNERGMFSLSGVPAGQQRLFLHHLGYGEHARLVLVPEADRLTVEARLSTRAIELAPLLVETMTEVDRRQATTGAQVNEVERPVIDLAHRTGQNLGDLLRQEIPGASVRPGWFGGACVEFRGARATGGRCREMTVFMDGVRIADPGLLLATLSPNDVESMEILSAAEAGARYGSVSSYGVLLIETRRPPRPGRRSLDESGRPQATLFDWSQESRPYAWKKTFATSFLANAVGVGAGLALAHQCLWRTEAGSLGLRTRCGGAATTGIGFLAMGLPAVGSALAAQWGGATDRSSGRVTPMSLTAALGLASGYMLVIHGTETSQAAGTIILGLGVPVLTTLADRIFRSLRQ